MTIIIWYLRFGFVVYYDVDDVNDAVTINIRLTKANYNRMWEIKVSLTSSVTLSVLKIKRRRSSSRVLNVNVSPLDHADRVRASGAGRVSSVFPERGGHRADDEFRGQRPPLGRPRLRDLHTTRTRCVCPVWMWRHVYTALYNIYIYKLIFTYILISCHVQAQ